MDRDTYFGFTAGVILAATLMTFVAIGVRDIGRAECERPLPRTESCEQKWVPKVAQEKTDGIKTLP